MSEKKQRKKTLAHQLNESLIADIVGFVKLGAYEHVAAEACGIPPEILAQWLNTASRPKGRAIYKLLAKEIMKAKAHARMMAEVELKSKDPQSWLTRGPGRETKDGLPGWSQPVRSKDPKTNINILMEGGQDNLLSRILELLRPFPEARAILARGLSKQEPPQLPLAQ